MMPGPHQPAVDRLAPVLRPSDSGTLVVVTGAGISAPSGLSTFRGTEPDALWKKDDVSKATRRFFEADPVEQWNWYLSRFSKIDSVRPNAAHEALVDLERIHEAAGSRFLLVTQNIDTLHEQAGSRKMIKVHGSSDRVRCSKQGCRFGAPKGSLARGEVDLERFHERPCAERLPACPSCGANLRAHVLFFDEMYTDHEDYRFHDLQCTLPVLRAVVFIGTSFAVGVTDMIASASRWAKVPAFAIDVRERDPGVAQHIEWLQAPAETLLPAAVAQL